MGPEAGPAHGLGVSRTRHKLEEGQRQERGEAGKPEPTGCVGGREEGLLRTQQTDQPPGPRTKQEEGRERPGLLPAARLTSLGLRVLGKHPEGITTPAERYPALDPLVTPPSLSLRRLDANGPQGELTSMARPLDRACELQFNSRGCAAGAQGWYPTPQSNNRRGGEDVPPLPQKQV